MSLLSANNLGRKSLDSETWLFRNLSVNLNAGEKTGLIGKTGSGKTLLLRSIAMLDRIDEGTISWQGRQVVSKMVPSFRRNVMYLHQHPVFAVGNVEQNLEVPFSFKSNSCNNSAAADSSKSYSSDDCIALLEQAGLDKAILHRSCEDLSGGEKQIVALIRCLLLEPQMLLLDEPTASLDEQTTERIELLIKDWFSNKSDGRSLLMVSHSEPQLTRMTDKIVRMQSHKGLSEEPEGRI